MTTTAGPPAAVFAVTALGEAAYIIDGLLNQALTLTRGQTYIFQVDAVGHPFWIKTAQVIGQADIYANGVMGNGVQSGNLTFAVPLDAPETLYYNCEYHTAMTGVITSKWMWLGTIGCWLVISHACRTWGDDGWMHCSC